MKEELPEEIKSYSQKNQRNYGSWNMEEQEKYIIFLQTFKKQLQSSKKIKELKLYKIMGDSISTRDGIQCRSHHMKKLRTFKKVRNIIQGFRKQHPISPLGLEFQKIMESIFDLGKNRSQGQILQTQEIQEVQPIRQVVHTSTEENQSQKIGIQENGEIVLLCPQFNMVPLQQIYFMQPQFYLEMWKFSPSSQNN